MPLAGRARNCKAAPAVQQFGSVLASSLQRRLFTQHQSMVDASAPAGRLYYWNSHYLPGLSNAAIDVIVDNAWRFSSPYSLTLLSHMGGAIRRHSDSESAFSGRDAEFTTNINCAATDQQLYEKDRAWVRQWFDALAPHSTGGAYVNFISEDGGERVRDVYSASTYRRLSQSSRQGAIHIRSGVNAFRHWSGGKCGGNDGDRQQFSAISSELTPEGLSRLASHNDRRRTAPNAILEASA